MSGLQINVGIDFGTHQSKVCVQIHDGRTDKYEFIPLDSSIQGIDAALFPSLVHVLAGDKFQIGPATGNSIKSYGFFKIASAQDADFLAFNSNRPPTYDLAEFAPYRPEQLAVLYVTGVILKVRDHVRSRHTEPQATSGPAFMRRFRPSSVPIDVVWRYRMGVPTEFHSTANPERKRKFEQILVLAIRLADRLGDQYWSTTISHILNEISRLNEELMQEVDYDPQTGVEPQTWRSILTQLKASVFPETAAGLIFLVKTEKLPVERYYISMDIGGGSTDISFFKMESNRTFTYLATQSVMLAANDVVLGMGTHSSLLHAREAITQLFQPQLLQEDTYIQAFKKVSSGLQKASYLMFNGQVYKRSPKYQATELYQDAVCYLYGGGSLLPAPSPNPLSRIMIFNNGVHYADVGQIHVEVKSIEDLSINKEILNTDWTERMRVLIVSLGLSLSLPEDRLVDYIIEDFVAPTGTHDFNSLWDFPTARWV